MSQGQAAELIPIKIRNHKKFKKNQSKKFKRSRAPSRLSAPTPWAVANLKSWSTKFEVALSSPNASSLQKRLDAIKFNCVRLRARVKFFPHLPPPPQGCNSEKTKLRIAPRLTNSARLVFNTSAFKSFLETLPIFFWIFIILLTGYLLQIPVCQM